jgi:hypothetical protein
MTPWYRDAMVATTTPWCDSLLDTGLDLDKLKEFFEILILK